ncbi:MAG TPA: NADH-quinone oxidoreductase subunit C [Vicinamibacterales bacterium]|jgi:NADH-quinone oxidoreductase subunit C|nr:NADH-quinone oxidoreductase subunit C [Vicinamibacterales bacterium]
MESAAIIEILRSAVPGAAYDVGHSVDMPTIYVPAEHLVATCGVLRDLPALQFNVLVEVTAADYLPREPRYEVVYHLLSVPKRQRLRVKVRVGANGSVPTVQGIWRGAGWPEREVWDMFGIEFDNHGDLRRLLMPEDWEGHPARKDYPVQIRKAAQTYEPLEVSEAEFRANIERDRLKRTN